MDLLFNSLILLSAGVICVYSLFYNKRAIPYLLVLTALSFIAVNFASQASLLFLLFLALPFLRKLSFPNLISCCLLPAIVLAHFALNVFQSPIPNPLLLATALICLSAISALGIFGLFQDKLIKYLLISNLVQLTFVLADLSVAAMAKKLEILGTIQIFNYVLAGLLLFLTLGLLSKNNKIALISSLQGLFYSNKFISAFAIISAISLAGLPGLNIFVAEWYLFITSYSITPMFTILGIFAALILFIMYFKIAYVLLVGKGPALPIPAPLTCIGGVLALLCIILGLVPQLQLLILGAI